jgi:hypothetical protein
MWRWWGLLVVVVGCGQPCRVDSQARKPRQDEAVKVVWNDVFLRSDAPPEVRWVQGTCLTCKDPSSGRPGFETSQGCREGWTILPTVVQVAWRDDDQYSTTTLAHEFLHALHFRIPTMPDPGHQSAGFRPLSECGDPAEPLCGIVERANAALSAAQM